MSKFIGLLGELHPDLPEEDEEQDGSGTDGNEAARTVRNSNQDRAQFSLNGTPATSKSQFVLDVVKAYVAKYPKKTFAELEEVFPISLCSKGYKFIGRKPPEKCIL